MNVPNVYIRVRHSENVRKRKKGNKGEKIALLSVVATREIKFMCSKKRERRKGERERLNFHPQNWKLFHFDSGCKLLPFSFLVGVNSKKFSPPFFQTLLFPADFFPFSRLVTTSFLSLFLRDINYKRFERKQQILELRFRSNDVDKRISMAVGPNGKNESGTCEKAISAEFNLIFFPFLSI